MTSGGRPGPGSDSICGIARWLCWVLRRSVLAPNPPQQPPYPPPFRGQDALPKRSASADSPIRSRTHQWRRRLDQHYRFPDWRSLLTRCSKIVRAPTKSPCVPGRMPSRRAPNRGTACFQFLGENQLSSSSGPAVPCSRARTARSPNRISPQDTRPYSMARAIDKASLTCNRAHLLAFITLDVPHSNEHKGGVWSPISRRCPMPRPQASVLPLLSPCLSLVTPICKCVGNTVPSPRCR
jgi:hypothetical protein